MTRGSERVKLENVNPLFFLFLIHFQYDCAYNILSISLAHLMDRHLHLRTQTHGTLMFTPPPSQIYVHIHLSNIRQWNVSFKKWWSLETKLAKDKLWKHIRTKTLRANTHFVCTPRKEGIRESKAALAIWKLSGWCNGGEGVHGTNLVPCMWQTDCWKTEVGGLARDQGWGWESVGKMKKSFVEMVRRERES